jgi:hypothetical protein
VVATLSAIPTAAEGIPAAEFTVSIWGESWIFCPLDKIVIIGIILQTFADACKCFQTFANACKNYVTILSEFPTKYF